MLAAFLFSLTEPLETHFHWSLSRLVMGAVAPTVRTVDLTTGISYSGGKAKRRARHQSAKLEKQFILN